MKRFRAISSAELESLDLQFDYVVILHLEDIQISSEGEMSCDS